MSAMLGHTQKHKRYEKSLYSETGPSGMQQGNSEEPRIPGTLILHVMMYSHCLPTNKLSSTYSMPIVQR